MLTSLDSTGGVYEAILPSLTAIEAALDGWIVAGSVVCSGRGAAAYAEAAVKAGTEHRRALVQTTTSRAVKAAPGRTKQRKGRLGLERVNAHHGQIKWPVNGRSRGVATPYLPTCLGWHRAMLQGEFSGKALLDRALVWKICR